MSSTATLKWIGLALLGIAIAAVVAIAAGNLVSRQIGLASEPISAGEDLAPAVSSNRAHGSSPDDGGNDRHRPPSTTPTVTTPPETTVPGPTTAPSGPDSPSQESSDDAGGKHDADD